MMIERVARALCEEAGMNSNNWPHKVKAARAAIEAIDGWSSDFSAAPHDTSLWVYATDDQGYAYGPASIWDKGNPNGPELVWNFDRKRRPINDGVERALMWHRVPQWPGEERLAAARSSLKGEGE